jgi:hypothetical protein
MERPHNTGDRHGLWSQLLLSNPDRTLLRYVIMGKSLNLGFLFKREVTVAPSWGLFEGLKDLRGCLRPLLLPFSNTFESTHCARGTISGARDMKVKERRT